MRALIISVLLYMVLAPSGATEGANVAQAEASVPVNDANPPAEETVPEALVENLLSLPEPLDGAHETPLTQSLCQTGWHDYQRRCFIFVNQRKTWIDAQKHCMGIGANLASTQSPRDDKFLQDLIVSGGGSPYTWLGGFSLQNKWMWMDGEALYYTNWYSGNPASTGVCMYMRSAADWYYSTCYYATVPFICVKRTC